MKCQGWLVTPEIDATGTQIGWIETQCEVENTGCDSPCGRPTLTVVGADQFPEVTCPAGCTPHTRESPDGGTEVWCCRD